MSLKRKNRQGFRPPKKIEEYWNLYKKDIYVEKPDKRLPPWFLPLIVFLLIVAVIFWAAPMALSRLQIDIGRDEDDSKEINYLYDDSFRAVAVPAADIFAQPDLKAERIAQALYNEPVQIIDDETLWGFVSVKLPDGTTGNMLIDDLSSGKDSLEPGLGFYKITVVTSAKRIMSHARSGTMLAEVLMGTQLISDYRGDGILRVLLPDGKLGWVSENGLMIIEADQRIEKSPDGARYFCSSAMAFHNMTVLENGQTRAGISTEGIARIAGLVNGIDMPRSIAKQMRFGEPVKLLYEVSEQEGSSEDDNTDNINDDTADGPASLPVVRLDIFQPSDLIFADNAANPGKPVSMAIVMENGQFLMARPGRTSMQLVDPAQIPDWTERIIAVRRLYPEMIEILEQTE